MGTEYTQPKTRLLVIARAITPWNDWYDSLGHYAPCEHCGQWTDRYELHHRKFRSRGGDWRPSNIILLCKPCHHQVTVDWQGHSREAGLWVSAWVHPEFVPIRLWWHREPVYLDNEGGFTPVGSETLR